MNIKKIYNKNPYLLYVILGFMILTTLTSIGANIEDTKRNTEALIAILVFLSFFLSGRGKAPNERVEGIFTGIIFGFITITAYLFMR